MIKLDLNVLIYAGVAAFVTSVIMKKNTEIEELKKEVNRLKKEA